MQLFIKKRLTCLPRCRILHVLFEKSERQIMKAYNFYSDAGHGWLRVKLNELDRLGIVEDITMFSYLFADIAYLEEDCDLATFMRAKQAAGETVEINEIHVGGNSVIRVYDTYTVESATAALD